MEPILTDVFSLMIYVLVALLLLGACIYQCYTYINRF